VITWSYVGCSSDIYPNDIGYSQAKITVDGYVGGPEFSSVASPTPAIKSEVIPVGDKTVDVALSDYIGVLPDQVINLFINPYASSSTAEGYTKLQVEIDRRFGAIVQLEGHQIITGDGSVSEMTTLVDGFNDAHCTLWDGGQNRPTPNYQQSAAVAGLMASSLSLDPVVPMQELEITGVLAEPAEKQRTFTELNAFVEAGIAIGSIDTQGNVRTSRLTTTYTVTDGLNDVSYRDANTIFTTSYLRQSILRLIAVKYKNYKLADDGIKAAPGQRVVTPQRMTATLLGWFTEMEYRAIVENYDQFKTELSVMRNATDKTRIDAVIPTDVVNQFRIFAGELQFIL
jgi:phage tail sheath gpL-like